MKKYWIKQGLTLFFILLFFYAAGNLFLIWQEYRQGDQLYHEAQAEFLEMPEVVTEFESEEAITWPQFTVDFSQLQAINSEVCGWVWIQDTVVNYPLVQSKKNNDVYLKKTYDGTYNSAGSIFMDYRNKKDFSDDNTILYGHNMKNGKMFAVLRKFGQQAFYDAHPIFYIMTPEGNRRYEIVSAFQTDALSTIYDREFANDSEKQAWIDRILRSSAIQTATEATTEDSFVTLSTCVSGEDYRARFVVIGKLADIEPATTEEMEAKE